MKRTSVKVLISASIILAMIPFSFLQVKADNPEQKYNFTSLMSFSESGNIVYFYYDTIFTSDVLCSGTLELRFDTNNTNNSWGMIDGNGVVDTTHTTSGTDRTIYINFYDTNFFIFRLTMRGTTSLFTDSVLKNPQSTFGWTRTVADIHLSQAQDSNVLLWDILQMQTSIRYFVREMYNNGIQIDTTNLETLFQDITTNQEDMISLLTEIRDGNQSSSSSSTASEQTTTDLQTATDDYNEIETDLSSDFTTNLQGIDTNTWTTRLTGWSSGINWLKTQMNNMFTSMGDYKYMLEIGMILAIALIFIGR